MRRRRLQRARAHLATDQSRREDAMHLTGCAHDYAYGLESQDGHTGIVVCLCRRCYAHHPGCACPACTAHRDAEADMGQTSDPTPHAAAPSSHAAPPSLPGTRWLAVTREEAGYIVDHAPYQHPALRPLFLKCASLLQEFEAEAAVQGATTHLQK